MPMRRVSTSLPRVGFADDASPLSEGMANAAATLGDLWPRLNQIEAQKHQDAANRQDRRDELDVRANERQQERADHQAAAAEHRSLWDVDHGVYAGPDQALRDASNQHATEHQHSLDTQAAQLGAYQGEDQALLDLSERMRAKPLGGRTAAPHDPSTGWHYDTPTQKHFRTNSKNEIEIFDPATGKRTMGGMSSTPDAPAIDKAPGDAGQPGLWDQMIAPLRRSGRPGIHSVGDVLGGVVDLWNGPGDQVPTNPPTATSTPPVVAAPASLNDDDLDRYLTQKDPDYAEARMHPKFNKAAALAAFRAGK